MRTTTSSSCWWVTKVISGISEPYPLTRPEPLQVSFISTQIFERRWHKRIIDGFNNICGVTFFSEKNNLSFIETSALDSTNVEEAFKNILTGMDLLFGGCIVLKEISLLIRFMSGFISIMGICCKILSHRSCDSTVDSSARILSIIR